MTQFSPSEPVRILSGATPLMCIQTHIGSSFVKYHRQITDETKGFVVKQKGLKYLINSDAGSFWFTEADLQSLCL